MRLNSVLSDPEHPMDILDNLESIVSKLGKEVPPPSNSVPLSENACLRCEGKFTIQPFLTYDGTVFLGEGAFIGPYSFLRGPLYIGKNVVIGPYCEITRSIVMDNSEISHKNIIPDSIIGKKAWIAGGTYTCNVRLDKKPVRLEWNGSTKERDKFGAVIEDGAKMGAAIILMPGTHVKKNACRYGPASLGGLVE